MGELGCEMQLKKRYLLPSSAILLVCALREKR